MKVSVSKRAKAGVGAGVILAGALVGAVMVSRSAAPDASAILHPGASKTFSLSAPPLGVPLVSASGAPMTSWGSSAALVALPNQLPVWARTAVTRLLGPTPWASEVPHLWAIPPKAEREVAAWSLPGADLVSLPTLLPTEGMSALEVTSVEKTLNLPSTHLKARLEGRRLVVATVPVPTGTPAYRTSVHVSWQKTLAGALPAHGAAVVVEQDGRVLAVAGYGQNATLAFDAAPVGLTLVPLMLAQAANHAAMFSHLKATAGLANLTALGSVWGTENVLTAYSHLGVENRPVFGAQVIPLPSPQAVNGSRLLATGQGVWTTPLAVARAYLALANRGVLPPLTYTASPSSTTGFTRDLSGITTANLTMVEKLLPELVAGGVTFRVWDPTPYRYDVALTGLPDGSTLVVAADGLSSQQEFQALLGTLGRLIGQGVAVRKANLSSR